MVSLLKSLKSNKKKAMRPGIALLYHRLNKFQYQNLFNVEILLDCERGKPNFHQETTRFQTHKSRVIRLTLMEYRLT